MHAVGVKKEIKKFNEINVPLICILSSQHGFHSLNIWIFPQKNMCEVFIITDIVIKSELAPCETVNCGLSVFSNLV